MSGHSLLVCETSPNFPIPPHLGGSGSRNFHMCTPHVVDLFLCWMLGLFPNILFWILWIVLLWILAWKYSSPFFSLLGIHLGVELLSNICLTFWGTTNLFSTPAAPFYIPTRNASKSFIFKIKKSRVKLVDSLTIYAESPLWHWHQKQVSWLPKHSCF